MQAIRGRPKGSGGKGKNMTQLDRLEIGDSLFMPVKITDGMKLASVRARLDRTVKKLGIKISLEIKNNKARITRVE